MHRKTLIAVVGYHGSGADQVADKLDLLGLPRGGADEVRDLHHGIISSFGGTPDFPRLPISWIKSQTGRMAVSALRFAIQNLLVAGKQVVSDPSMCIFPGLWGAAMEDLEVDGKVVVVTRDKEESMVELRAIYPENSYGELRWLLGDAGDGVRTWTTIFEGTCVAVKHEDLCNRGLFMEISKALDVDWPEPLTADRWSDIEKLTEGVVQ